MPDSIENAVEPEQATVPSFEAVVKGDPIVRSGGDGANGEGAPTQAEVLGARLKNRRRAVRTSDGEVDRTERLVEVRHGDRKRPARFESPEPPVRIARLSWRTMHACSRERSLSNPTVASASITSYRRAWR